MRFRAALVLLLAIGWCGGIAVRLWQLQIRDHELYRERAEGQHHRRVTLEPPRGTIFDARGRELALSVDVDSAWADPSKVEDPAGFARALAAVLDLEARKLEALLASEREFVWIARQLDRPEAAAVREIALPGVGFLKESKRYYPMRGLAAQVVGFAGLDNKGLEGLEQAYNEVIAGKPVARKVLRDARRGTVLLPDMAFQQAEPGQDLHLTIDAWIQYLLEREIAAAVDRTGAKGAVGVILDPGTGAILAMASLPGFDPNRFAQSERARWRNRAVTDAFEPGSTFKMVTAAAAIASNLVDPGDRIDCEHGSVLVEGVRIHDHKPFGELTFREVIARSSNVGAIKAGLRVGSRGLYRQILDFGFGQVSGVDLPGESPGILRSLERWPKRAPAYISFGQSLSVTALQMANAFAAVANGGTLYRPYVVAGIGNQGSIQDLHPRPQVLRQAIESSTALSLERLLEAVVTEGTGQRAVISGYRVAGKTGTAQKAAAGGGYADGKYVASFVGFAPARRPAVVAMIAIDEPHPSLGYHGGDVAAPVFSSVVGPTLLYLGIPPEREAPQRWPAERVADSALDSTRRDSAELAAATAVGARRQTAAGLPSFHGLTARDAVIRSARFGLTTRLHGRGRVSRQSPPPGTALEAAEGRLELWLASGGG